MPHRLRAATGSSCDLDGSSGSISPPDPAQRLVDAEDFDRGRFAGDRDPVETCGECTSRVIAAVPHDIDINLIVRKSSHRAACGIVHGG